MSKILKIQYLKLYNVISCFLWMSVLLRTGLIWGITKDTAVVFHETNTLVRWVQTLAIAEVFHSIFGLVSSSPLTTIIQVASRIYLVWGVCYPFSYVIEGSPIYLSMIIAWSITEIIRYAFYAFNLNGDIPAFLTWLRYNTFLILYPIGAGSEFLLVLKSRIAAQYVWSLNKLLWPILMSIYPPGLYIMYTHMLAQRRKISKRAAARRT
ncbi:putative very-long-chain (3R)-3-hydroxyacyl-CoA dehydratase [Schizosaccharomyces pombe]